MLKLNVIGKPGLQPWLRMVVGSITLGFASSGVSQVRMTSPVPPTPDVDETLESVDSSEEGGVFSAI